MREKIVLRGRAVPTLVNLPNGTFFVATYEMICKKELTRA